ncbi:MAG: cytochrome c oxidase subunit 3 [Verrucomicrobiota bacterium]
MEIPYTVTARTDTGLWNAKIGIWLFLASEVMLFGGLFSGYVFLRIGIGDIDNPWPERQLPILPGFINTLVLIGSSVLVVFAWASLKMRNYAKYQIYMVGVLVCALAFLVIKSVEYYGKFTHYGIKLSDQTIFEGYVKKDNIEFEATDLLLDPRQTRLNILEGLKAGQEPLFKTPDGEEILLDTAWLRSYRVEARNALVEAQRAEVEAAEAEGRVANPPKQLERLKLTAVKPLQFAFNPRRVRTYADGLVVYQDQHSVEGTLIDDSIVFEVHDINLQAVKDQENALAWQFVDDGIKEQFFDHQAKVLKDTEARGVRPDPYELNVLKHVHGHAREPVSGELKEGGGDGGAPGVGVESEPSEADETVPKPETGGETEGVSPEGAHGKEGHHAEESYPLVKIPRALKLFLSNHGPAYNTYYAIYFTMTGLHGLHVIGGALVLAYFLLFNKRLYQQNPEHLANRVEVGGLFWHFVDLVWIFLFPIMYLM